MKPIKASKRRIWVGAAILFWLAVGVGVGAPLIFNFAGDEVQFDNAGVVAAPRDSFKITSPLLLDDASGTTISSGTLAIATPKGKILTAEASATLLKRGEAVLLLDNGELSIGGSAAEIANAQSTASAPLAKALQEGRFKALGLRHGTIIVALPNGHRERLTRANLRMVPSGNGTIEAKGEGFWRGQRSKFSLTTSGAIKDGIVPVKLSFQATLLEITYEGKFELDGAHTVQGAAVLHLKNTEKLANALGTSWPIGTSVQNIRLEGPVRWKSDTLAFDQAEVRVGDNQAQGTASLKTAGGRALISSTLAFDTLDIAPYLPNGSTDRAALAWQWWSKLVSTLSQPAAPHINADIRLSAKTLSSGEHSLGAAAATISMKNGKLSADIAEIMLVNGRATGQVSIDFNRYIPKLALRGRLEEIATGKWSETLAGHRYIEGQGRIVADLTSQGTSIQQIIGDLSGTVEFSVPENGAIGLSLVELNLAQDKSRAQTNKEILARVLRGSTVVNDLEAVWKIKDGVGKIVKASVGHANGTAKLSGSFDLTQNAYGFRILSFAGIAKPKTDEKSGTQGEKSATVAAPAPRVPPAATLLSVNSHKKERRSSGLVANSGAEPDIQLRTLIGPLKELERFLGPNYSKIPRRGL